MFKVSKYFTLFAFTLLHFIPLRGESPKEAQLSTLTLQQCVTRAIESNFSILIEANRLEIDRNNFNLEPFMPKISISSQLSDMTAERGDWSSPDQIERSSSRTTSLVNGANLSWRLFDGLAMFA
ncbi:MAG: TolC family protein, partial [Bacteroidales bacterium]